MSIDHATRAFLEEAAAAGRKPLHESTPEEARQSGEASIALYGAGPAMESRDVTLATQDGGEFVVRVLKPSDAPAAVLVYYHGGGWVIGNIDIFDTLGRTLAERANVAVVMVNYRKAPEHPFPAAVEDAWTALRWAHRNVESIAGSAVPMLIGGDSAGGNLAVVTALRARRAGFPRIELALLAYPILDCDFDRASYVDPENQLLLSRESMEWFFALYTAGEDRTDPEISPLRTPDLTGFPPTVIVLAEHDPLKDEGIAFAERLAELGALRERRLFAGQMHGFFSMVNVLPESATAIEVFVAQVQARLDELEGEV